MHIHCTRPGCVQPTNSLSNTDDKNIFRNLQQKYCLSCGMPLILENRYVPLQLLQQGGFGTAFLAYDRHTPTMRECVIKQLRPFSALGATQSDKVTKLFHREAEVLDELGTHPQIPHLFAFFKLVVSHPHTNQQQELFYLVQEYIHGENLEQEIARKGKFSEAEVLEVLQEILEILEFVHDTDSIHRDIKPSNIMRAQNGKLYLIDFGAVKRVMISGAENSTSSGHILSEHLTGVFTPGFAPPEQTQCIGVYKSTDLYALGATCIYLLTRKPPTAMFNSYTNSWTWRSHVKVSKRLAHVLDKMLLPAPQERFQSATEVLSALASSRRGGEFSDTDLVTTAIFAGFEGGLLVIAFNSLLKLLPISVGLVGMLLGGLVYARYRHLLTNTHLLVLGVITLAIVLLVSNLRTWSPIATVSLNPLVIVLVAVMAGTTAFAFVALSQLIYKIISRFV